MPGSQQPGRAHLAGQRDRAGGRACQLPAPGPMNTQKPSSWAGSEAQVTGSPPPSRWLQHASSRASQNWRQGGGAGGGRAPQGGASSRQKNQARKRWQCVWRRPPHARAAARTSSLVPWCRWLGSQECLMPRWLQTGREGDRGRQRPAAWTGCPAGVSGSAPSSAELLARPGPTESATGADQAPLSPVIAESGIRDTRMGGPEERAEGAARAPRGPVTRGSRCGVRLRMSGSWCCWPGRAAVAGSPPLSRSRGRPGDHWLPQGGAPPGAEDRAALPGDGGGTEGPPGK